MTSSSAIAGFVRGSLFYLMAVLLKGPVYHDEMWNLETIGVWVLFNLIYACDLIQYRQN